ncbi:queuine tRNA-ribosyltransferase, putative [Babesia ovata]|uniref:Queuine tRNA-ribosyltransferase, putative n=1 Tax=Babesia ovata TaxID=189622 RepID=A0A2H6KGV0_9APIC|nr:queuine tRNA-ribosyltransferase, putative [Babesia ovata]GBE62214.1 queuine tRNA-ribosyltransferase, putative [Babesia ovata]
MFYTPQPNPRIAQQRARREHALEAENITLKRFRRKKTVNSNVHTDPAQLNLLVMTPTVVGVHEVPDLNTSVGSQDFELNETVLTLRVLPEVKANRTRILSIPHNALLVDDLAQGERNADVVRAVPDVSLAVQVGLDGGQLGSLSFLSSRSFLSGLLFLSEILLINFTILGLLLLIIIVRVGVIFGLFGSLFAGNLVILILLFLRLSNRRGKGGCLTPLPTTAGEGSLNPFITFTSLNDLLAPVNVVRPVVSEARDTSLPAHQVLLEQGKHFTLVQEQSVLISLRVGVQVQPLHIVRPGVDQLQQDTLDVVTAEHDHTGNNLGVKLIETPDNVFPVTNLVDDTVVTGKECRNLLVVLRHKLDHTLVVVVLLADINTGLNHAPEAQRSVGGTTDLLEVVVLVGLVEVKHDLVTLTVVGNDLQEVLAIRQLVNRSLGDNVTRGCENRNARLIDLIEQVTFSRVVNNPVNLVRTHDGMDLVAIFLTTLKLETDELVLFELLQELLVSRTIQLVTTVVSVKLLLQRQVHVLIGVGVRVVRLNSNRRNRTPGLSTVNQTTNGTRSLSLINILDELGSALLNFPVNPGGSILSILQGLRHLSLLVVGHNNDIQEGLVEGVLVYRHPQVVALDEVVRLTLTSHLVNSIETEKIHILNLVVDDLGGQVLALRVVNNLIAVNETVKRVTIDSRQHLPGNKVANLDTVSVPGIVYNLLKIKSDGGAPGEVLKLIGRVLLSLNRNMLTEHVGNKRRVHTLHHLGLGNREPAVAALLHVVLVRGTLVSDGGELYQLNTLKGDDVGEMLNTHTRAIPDHTLTVVKAVYQVTFVGSTEGLDIARSVVGSVRTPVVIRLGRVAHVDLDELSAVEKVRFLIRRRRNLDHSEKFRVGLLSCLALVTTVNVKASLRVVRDAAVATSTLHVQILINKTVPIHSTDDTEVLVFVRVSHNLQTDLSRQRIVYPQLPSASNNLLNVVVELRVVDSDLLGRVLVGTHNVVLLKVLRLGVKVERVRGTMGRPAPDEVRTSNHGEGGLSL